MSRRALHIVSWNVAGWIPTSTFLIQRFKSVGAWLERHKIDILCLQEVKVGRDKLATDPAKFLVPGFDTVWMPCAPHVKGFNGVATFVKSSENFRITGIDYTPLREAALDEEGRCVVVTLSNGMALVNIYAPNDGDMGRRLPIKIKFLKSVKQAVNRLKTSGFRVVLLGDFNLLSRHQDAHYEFRWINIERLLQDSFIPKELQAFVTDFREKYWFALKDAMRDAVFTQEGDKWKIRVPSVTDASKKCIVHFQFYSEEEAKLAIELSPTYVEGVLLKPESVIECGVLFEMLKALFGVDFQSSFQRRISDLFGIPRCSPESVRWIQDLMTNSGMSDTFAEFHPTAEDRFTCWDQYRNHRYQNKGSRIDYVLADQRLELEVGGPLALVGNDAYTAFRCASADRRWQPAPRDGSGLASVADNTEAFEWEFQCSQPPRSGMIYTAPIFSDHIAVSALIVPPVDAADSAVSADMIETLKKSKVSMMESSIIMPGKEKPQAVGALKALFRKIEAQNDGRISKKARLD